MSTFWDDMVRPFMVLAPMADVTDPAFRRVIAQYGKPDVLWTEFVSADGLYHTREVNKLPDDENPLLKDLVYGENEHPIIVQLFSAKPEMMEYAAALMVDLGFDGVDINMGCPDRSVEKQGAGASLMKQPELAVELIEAAKSGVQGKIPVSVKTRIGYNKNELDMWLPKLLSAEPAAVTVHTRTRKELSLVPARWEHIEEAVRIRDAAGSKTYIIGNGDVETPEQGRVLAKEYGADGVMIGRGIFGNPWLFSEQVPGLDEKLRVLQEHCDAFSELCGHKSFAVMKKHFKAYVTGFDGAKEMRIELMGCNTAEEVAEVITKWRNKV